MAGSRSTPPPLPQQQPVTTAVHLYYTPLLVVLGCLGNMLSVYVLVRSKLRRLSTCQYLSALAVSDSLFLLLQLPPWLSLVGACDVFLRDGFCQVFVYLSYVSCCASAWLVVGFTVERWVAVRFPLRRPAMCTVQRARLMVAAALALSLLANAPVLRFAAIVEGDCHIDKSYMEHAKYFNVSDTIVAFSAPMLIISVLNTVITVHVRRVQRERELFFKAAQRGSGPPQPPHRLYTQAKITRMLLTVSTVFVMLNMPAYVMRLVAYTTAFDEMAPEGSLQAVQQVALLFFNTNFGINFMLYCLTGQNFRRALVASMPCLRRRTIQRDAARRAASPRNNRNNSISTSLASNMTEPAGGTGGTGIAVGAVGAVGEAESSAGIAAPRQHVVRRWRFDNSRQKQALEMTRLAPTHHI